MPRHPPHALLPASIFFANALLYVSLYSRLPEVSAGLSVAPAALGLALLAQTGGTLLGFPAASVLIERFGARRVAGAMLLLAAIVLPLAASGQVAPGLLGLALPLFVYGFAMAVIEVAKNLIAARIEERSGRNVISKSHGFWSAGMFVGALMAGQAAAAGVSCTRMLIWIGLATLPLIALLMLRAGDPEPIGPAPSPKASFAAPDAFVICLLILVAGFSITEGVIYDWSMFYLRNDLQLGARHAAWIYAAFTLGMIGARMAGDDLRRRLRTRHLIRYMALMTLAGIALAVIAPAASLPPTALGAAFALIGAGVALAAPVASALAMRHPTRSATRTMASYSLISLLALFAVPPLMGAVVETRGAVWAILFATPLLALVALIAPRLIARMGSSS